MSDFEPDEPNETLSILQAGEEDALHFEEAVGHWFNAIVDEVEAQEKTKKSKPRG